MSSIILTGDTSGTVQIAAPAVAGTSVIILPVGSGTAAVQGVSTNIVSGTALSTNGLTSIAFTGIPSWAKRVTLMFNAVTLGGTAIPIVQLGVGSTPTTSGYVGSTTQLSASSSGTQSVTTGVGFYYTVATQVISGHMIFTNVSGNIWIGSGTSAAGAAGLASVGAGAVTLGGTLGMLQLTSVGTANTFGTGSVNILYE